MPHVRDGWMAGSAYESFMGRWSRQLAGRFVPWLRVPSGVHWLDVGCGTGALTGAICRDAHPASVLGCDLAEPLIEYARRHTGDACASFVIAGVGDLPRRADGYGCVASLLALNFFPDAQAAVDEMRSCTTTRGTVSACVWDYGGRMDLLRYFWDAAVAVDPTARELDEGERFPLCRPDALTDLFRRSGLGDVRCEAIDVPTEFASFEDYWQSFLGGTGPAPSYVASLDNERRTMMARRLEDALPRQRGGEISLRARAWAVRGTAN